MNDEAPPRLSDTESKAWRGRQQARANVTALVLGALCILFFVITVVKIGNAG